MNGERPESMNAVGLKVKLNNYEALIRKVLDSGGYGNVVLAESLRRLSLATIGGLLVRRQLVDAEMTRLIKADRVSLWNSSAFQRLLADEAAALKYRQTIPVDVEDAYKMWGIAPLGEVMREALSTAKPLDQDRSVLRLATRILDGEATQEVSVAGLAEFLRRGGKIQDIRLDDVPPFFWP